MEEYSYNEHQKLKKNINFPLSRIVLGLVFLFWLSNHVDIAGALSNKPLTIFIFINFIIFALCFLASQKPIPEDMGSQKYGLPADDVPSLPEKGNEDCRHMEETVVDKHVILVENAGKEIVSVSMDISNEISLETIRMSNELMIAMREPRWRSMDDMRNGEFMFAIEAFTDARED